MGSRDEDELKELQDPQTWEALPGGGVRGRQNNRALSYLWRSRERTFARSLSAPDVEG
jgi:hypothetical protein